jgi:undecaprenyl-diphosphatase
MTDMNELNREVPMKSSYILTGISALLVLAIGGFFLWQSNKSPLPVQTINETKLQAYTTGYSYWDNTPPGSSEIAFEKSRGFPTFHDVANGTGTFEDPITLAVGWTLLGATSTPDFAPGTKFYIPNVRRYFVVEDLCGDVKKDGTLPQNEPCHVPEQWAVDKGAQIQIDLWIDGKSGTAKTTIDCMNAVTGDGPHLVIKDPNSNYRVVPGLPLQQRRLHAAFWRPTPNNLSYTEDMSGVESFILGIIEGITEFLPISSTGHLILASELLKIGQSDFQKSFEIIIQLGAICAVIILYWRQFLNIEILKRLVVAFIPTGVIGLALYKIIKTYLLGSTAVVLWAMLLGGIALIVFELWYKHSDGETAMAKKSSLGDISYVQAAAIGLFQAIAIIPGVSRSAATIVGGLVVGLKRTTIVEFSFLLAVPTMLAATGLDLYKNASSFSSADTLNLAIGFVTALVVAIFAIKFLLTFIRTHTFIPFGIYRVVIAVVFWMLFFY